MVTYAGYASYESKCQSNNAELILHKNNIMVGSEGTVKLMDMGHVVRDSSSCQTQQRTGS